MLLAITLIIVILFVLRYRQLKSATPSSRKETYVQLPITLPGRPESVADKELSVLEDYFNVFPQNREKITERREPDMLPFNSYAYGTSTLTPMQPHPIKLILDPVQENIPTMRDHVLSAMSDFFGVPKMDIEELMPQVVISAKKAIEAAEAAAAPQALSP